MLTLTTQPAATPARAAADRWIDLREASRRSGLVQGHLARMCASAWKAAGLAELRKAGKGKPHWHVREEADPAFAVAKSVDQHVAEFDMSIYSAAQREAILRGEQIVKEFDSVLRNAVATGGDKRAAVEAFVLTLQARRTPVKRTTLYSWHEGYFKAGQGRKALVDGRWIIAQKDAQDPSQFAHFFAEMEYWYLDQNEKSKLACYKLARAMAKQKSWPVPNSGHAARHLKRLDRRAVILHRKGPKAFDDQCAAYIQRDRTRFFTPEGIEREMWSDDVWCGDHHQCDTLVKFHGKLVRPWLTAWMDIRSMRIVGYVFFCGDPSTTTVVAALAHAVNQTQSAPIYFYVDNGKDYDSYGLQGLTKGERKFKKIGDKLKWVRKRIKPQHDEQLFGGVFGTLGGSAIHANPYNARAKNIERFFGTFEAQYGKLQPTYCGRSPAHKPEGLPERLEKGLAPEFDDYAAGACTWIERVYHVTPSAAQGMEGKSPMEIYKQQLVQVRPCHPESLRQALHLPTQPLTVGRNGVTWDGRLYGMGDPILSLHEKVRLRIDPADITRVVAYTLEDQRIGQIVANELLGWGKVPKEQMDRVQGNVRRHNRQVKETIKKAGMRILHDPIEMLAQDAADQQAARRALEGAPDPDPPPSIKPIRTPFDAQLNAAQTPFKKAMGDGVIDARTGEFFGRQKPAVSLLDSLKFTADEAPARTPARSLLSLLDAEE